MDTLHDSGVETTTHTNEKLKECLELIKREEAIHETKTRIVNQVSKFQLEYTASRKLIAVNTLFCNELTDKVNKHKIVTEQTEEQARIIRTERETLRAQILALEQQDEALKQRQQDLDAKNKEARESIEKIHAQQAQAFALIRTHEESKLRTQKLIDEQNVIIKKLDDELNQLLCLPPVITTVGTNPVGSVTDVVVAVVAPPALPEPTAVEADPTPQSSPPPSTEVIESVVETVLSSVSQRIVVDTKDDESVRQPDSPSPRNVSTDEGSTDGHDGHDEKDEDEEDDEKSVATAVTKSTYVTPSPAKPAVPESETTNDSLLNSWELTPKAAGPVYQHLFPGFGSIGFLRLDGSSRRSSPAASVVPPVAASSSSSSSASSSAPLTSPQLALMHSPVRAFVPMTPAQSVVPEMYGTPLGRVLEDEPWNLIFGSTDSKVPSYTVGSPDNDNENDQEEAELAGEVDEEERLRRQKQQQEDEDEEAIQKIVVGEDSMDFTSDGNDDDNEEVSGEDSHGAAGAAAQPARRQYPRRGGVPYLMKVSNESEVDTPDEYKSSKSKKRKRSQASNDAKRTRIDSIPLPLPLSAKGTSLELERIHQMGAKTMLGAFPTKWAKSTKEHKWNSKGLGDLTGNEVVTVTLKKETFAHLKEVATCQGMQIDFSKKNGPNRAFTSCMTKGIRILRSARSENGNFCEFCKMNLCVDLNRRISYPARGLYKDGLVQCKAHFYHAECAAFLSCLDEKTLYPNDEVNINEVRVFKCIGKGCSPPKNHPASVDDQVSEDETESEPRQTEFML